MLSDRIRIAREQVPLTQEDLAVKIHSTKNSVNNWETGRAIPHPKTLLKISQILKKSVPWLKGEIPVEQEPATSANFAVIQLEDARAQGVSGPDRSDLPPGRQDAPPRPSSKEQPGTSLLAQMERMVEILARQQDAQREHTDRLADMLAKQMVENSRLVDMLARQQDLFATQQQFQMKLACHPPRRAQIHDPVASPGRAAE